MSALPTWIGFFAGAVTSFSINGITSQAQGYISTHGGLNAINTGPASSRSDGIDFLSFNDFIGDQAPDVLSALSEFSANSQTASADFRVDLVMSRRVV